MVHIRQPRSDSGLGFRVKVRETFSDVPALLGSGALRNRVAHQELIGVGWGGETYRDTSLRRHSASLGPYTRIMPKALQWS